jgi:hypothetical protein
VESTNPVASFLDIWELIDGDSVLITNRLEDVPSWFQLHPSEVCGNLTFQLLQEIGERTQQEEPMELANVWRVLPGDYVAWIGPSRPTVQAQNHVLDLATFHSSAAIIGQPKTLNLEDMYGFRAPDGAPNAEQSGALRAVGRHVSQQPASYLAMEWVLGA